MTNVLNLPARAQSEATLAPWRAYFAEVALHIVNDHQFDWPIRAECDPESVSGISPENPSLSFVIATPVYEERYIMIAEGDRVQLVGTAKYHYETEDILSGSVASSFRTAWYERTRAYDGVLKAVHFVRPMGRTMLANAMTDCKARPLPRL